MTLIKQNEAKTKQLVADILRQAKNKGATAAEVGVSQHIGFSLNVRLGEVETIEYNNGQSFGITVFIGNRKGMASTSDTRPASIAASIDAACRIARYTAEDTFSGLADPVELAQEIQDLDLYHPWELSPDQGIQIALECENKALSVDKRIINSEGSSLSTSQGLYVYGNTHNFIGSVETTRHSLTCIVLAKQGDDMQRDYGYTIARSALQLDSSETVARDAAERTLNRLGARTIPTQQVPVLFSADMARTLIGNFIGAISGGHLYRRSSFLCDQLNKQIFSKKVHIYEDPFILQGLGSSCFDSDGVATRRQDFIKDGILKNYVLGSYSARKLGMKTTGNADGVHNLIVIPEDKTQADLIKEMGTGLFVTEMMGQGVNQVTGDYSRGAAGFWVENGEIQYPVNEISIAGNLKDMFNNIVAIGNDVDKRGNIRSGSLLIEQMTVAGA